MLFAEKRGCLFKLKFFIRCVFLRVGVLPVSLFFSLLQPFPGVGERGAAPPDMVNETVLTLFRIARSGWWDERPSLCFAWWAERVGARSG